MIALAADNKWRGTSRPTKAVGLSVHEAPFIRMMRRRFICPEPRCGSFIWAQQPLNPIRHLLLPGQQSVNNWAQFASHDYSDDLRLVDETSRIVQQPPSFESLHSPLRDQGHRSLGFLNQLHRHPVRSLSNPYRSKRSDVEFNACHISLPTCSVKRESADNQNAFAGSRKHHGGHFKTRNINFPALE